MHHHVGDVAVDEDLSRAEALPHEKMARENKYSREAHTSRQSRRLKKQTKK